MRKQKHFMNSEKNLIKIKSGFNYLLNTW